MQYPGEDSPSVRLRKARKLAGLTLAQAGQRVGRTRQCVHNWEQDPSEVRAGSLQQLCLVYGVTVDSVLDPRAEGPISAQARRIATEFDALPRDVQQRWLMLWQVLGRRGVADPIAR